MTDPKIKYDIAATVSGDAEVERLAGDLERLGRSLDGDLKTRADAAAQALRELGARNAAAQNFFELKQRSQDAAMAMEQAQTAAQAMARELAQSETPTRTQTGQLAKLRDAVNAAGREYLASHAALSAARDGLGQYGLSVEGLAQSQQVLKREIDASKRALTELGPELQKEAAQRKAAADQAAQAEVAAAARIAEAERARAAALAETKHAADQAAQAARDAAKKLADSFGTVGVKSVQAIEAEIVQVRVALERLQTEGGLSGAALGQAMQSAQGRIKALERDLREANGQLTLGDKLARTFSGAFGQFTAANLAATAIAGLVSRIQDMGRAFVAANVEIDGMRRALGTIYKDAGVAESQIGFLRKTANDAGVSFSSLTDSFKAFTASATASNIPLSVQNELFASVAKAGATLGLSGEKVSKALLALSQMASKGTVSMEELRGQLGESLPGALSLAAKGLGLTEQELIKLVESGGLAARHLFPALSQSLKAMVGENDSAAGAWERFKNAITQTMSAVGDAGGMTVLTVSIKGLAGALGVVMVPLQGLIEILFGVVRSAKAAAVAVFALADTGTTWAEKTVIFKQVGIDLANSFRIYP